MIYLYFLSLIIIAGICFYLTKKDIISPAFIFIAGFLFQAIWALLYSKRWELGLHLNTMLVLLIGILEFLIVTFIISKTFELKKVKNKNSNMQEINISQWKKIAYLSCISLFTIFYLYLIVKAVGGNFNSFANISDAISKYDKLSKFTDNFDAVKMPFIVSNLRVAIIASGYWFGYIIINNFLINKKVKVIEIMIVIITLILSIITGSRTPAFMMIIALISYFLILKSKKINYKNHFDKKTIRIIAIIGIVFLLSFVSFGNLLGRDIKTNKMEYLSVYIGAEVKNLDLFLQEQNYISKNPIFASQTLRPIINTFGQKIGFKGYEQYNLDLPFRSVNGYNLGNVYTTFYPYIYDFGYIGLIIFTFIMAFISQYVYEKTKVSRFKDVPIMSILIYGSIFGCLALSFFSNKFYEIIISFNFLKYIITWFCCNWFFVKKSNFIK